MSKKIPKFTRAQLEAYVGNSLRDMTSLEMWLSQTLLNAREEIARLKRGEFICKRCGLRKDADASRIPADF